MTKLNQALAERFKARFPGTKVKIADDGTDAALKALLDSKADIAAIGRSLTNEEKAQGLATTPVTRHKIALIVGPNNPFKGSLTIAQFAKIFRGEITNWSQVGGASRTIWLVDRPETSDSRRAFQNYPVFQTAPFVSSGDAVRLVDDNTEAVIKELRADGIGYAIADQVVNNPNVRIIPMHNTPPTDARYPFSQPLLYAYKGPTPSSGVQAFLGYVTAAENKQVIETARAADAIAASSGAVTSPNSAAASKTTAAKLVASPDTTVTASPAAAKATATASPVAIAASPGAQAGTSADPAGAGAAMSESEGGGLPWWIWLLPLALLAGLLWWLLKGRASQAGAGVLPGAAAAQVPKGHLILVPRDSDDTYAYWEVAEEHKAELQQQGGQDLTLRVYDTTGINLDQEPAHIVWEYACEEQVPDLHIPTPASDRDYTAELGYTTADGHWLTLARSAPVRVAEAELTETTSEAVPDTPETPAATTSDLTWDTAETASGDAVSTATVPSEQSSEQPSDTIEAPSNVAGDALQPFGAAAGAAAIAGLGTAAHSLFSNGQSQLVGDRPAESGSPSISQSTVRDVCQIILVPRNSKDAYAYWEVSDNYKSALRQQGGRKFILKVHDATNLDIDDQPPHNTQEYPCEEHEQDKHVSIPVSDRDYIAALGYYTDDHRWLRIIRSFHVHVPADEMSL